MNAAPIKSENEAKYQPRKFEIPALMIWAVVALYAAIHFANFLLLVYLYGFARVRSEQLHFTATPKGHEWVVSNGDHIAGGVQSLHYPITTVLWLVLFFATAWIIRRLLPERKGAAPVP